MFTLPVKVEFKDWPSESIELQTDCCVAAGYTGRDQESVQAHIDELKKLGVATPYSTPALYWVSPARLTSHRQIVVVGEKTSPEVEFFIGSDQTGNLFITVASDHTDRELEAVSVGKSKMVCDKILGDTFWSVEDIAPHWDKIQISSRVRIGNTWETYQTGTLQQVLPLSELLDLIKKDSPCMSSPSLLSSTVPLLTGEPVFTSGCIIVMFDPVLNREIEKQYEIFVLPDRS